MKSPLELAKNWPS